MLPRISLAALLLIPFLLGIQSCDQGEYFDDSIDGAFLSAFETNTKEADIFIGDKACVTIEGERGGCTVFRKTTQTFRFLVAPDGGNGEITFVSCQREETKSYLNGNPIEFELTDLTVDDDCDIGVVIFSDRMAPKRASILGSIHLRISDINFQKLGEITAKLDGKNLKILASKYSRQLLVEKNFRTVVNQEKNNMVRIRADPGDHFTIRAFSDLGRTAREELTIE